MQHRDRKRLREFVQMLMDMKSDAEITAMWNAEHVPLITVSVVTSIRATDGAQQPRALPTQREIEKLCEVIQSQWSPQERRHRGRGNGYVPAEVPSVKVVGLR